MLNLSVNIGKLKLKNPVIVASGTFGYAEEFEDFCDLKKIGAIVTKTITLRPRRGNPPPRLVETPSGLLNSIGLQNNGYEQFVKEKLPYLRKLNIPLIVSVGAEEGSEFRQVVRKLDRLKEVDAVELNISCPNIKETRDKRQEIRLISQDPQATYNLVKSLRRLTRKVLIVKLSPNVTDILEIAESSQAAGADSISLVNTFYGMSIDVNQRKPHLANIIGGLSGPAIRPLALALVYKVAQKIRIPVIGMGGIMNTQDALEFIIAGASAVSIGTANFVNPRTSIEVLNGIKKYLLKNKIKDINKLSGSIKT
jgi:dihydroorotate dehydrogenase (NAD+) catalytic subunit